MSDVSRPLVGCDACGRLALNVHLLPTAEACERIEFGCPGHDLGGFVFPLERLWSDAFAGLSAEQIEALTPAEIGALATAEAEGAEQ